MTMDKQPMKIMAILDMYMYDGVPNEGGMQGFREILHRYKERNTINLNLSFEVLMSAEMLRFKVWILIFTYLPADYYSIGRQWGHRMGKEMTISILIR